jgi:hypothetical protein
MTTKLIALIYFYLVSAASLALIVIGIFSTVNFLINISQYDEYPLRYYNEDCESFPSRYGGKPYPVAMEGTPAESTPSASELAEMKKQCIANFPLARKHT